MIIGSYYKEQREDINMTYYNPKIYNYAHLNKEDKNIFDYMIIVLMDNLESCIQDKKDELDFEDTDLAERLSLEAQIKGLEEANERLQCELVEFIVSRIDDYVTDEETDDIEEIDTDDYFYRCPYIQNDDE